MEAEQEQSEEHIQYTPPAQNQSPLSGMPGMPSMPSSPFGTIKWIFFGIIGFVCFFGLVNVFLQFISPKKQTPPATQNAAISPSTAVTTEWKTFTNKKYNYSVAYPSTLRTSDQTPYSTVFLAPNQIPNKLQFPTLYISVIPDGLTDASLVYDFMPADILQKINTANIGDVIETQDGIGADYFTFKKLAVIPISGVNAVVIENDKVLDSEGTANRRIIFKKGNLTYMLGSFYSSQDELDSFRKFEESFTLK